MMTLSIIGTVNRVAALWTDDRHVTIHLSHNGHLDTELSETGAVWDDGGGMWVAPVAAAEEVCAILDRQGYTWALDWRDRPRTWAERLVVELPSDVREAVCGLLMEEFNRRGDGDHYALLRYAWDLYNPQGPSDTDPAGADMSMQNDRPAVVNDTSDPST